MCMNNNPDRPGDEFGIIGIPFYTEAIPEYPLTVAQQKAKIAEKRILDLSLELGELASHQHHNLEEETFEKK